MPRPKKTAAQLEKTRQRILDAAFAILQAEGPQAVSSRAIAEHLGMAHMALYTYFRNQGAILSALGDRETAKYKAQQQTFEQRAESEDIIQVVRDVLTQSITFANENPNLYRLVWVFPKILGDRPEKSQQRMRHTVESFSRLLTIGMDQCKVVKRNPFLAAATALGMVNMPYILFHNGRLTDPNLRDLLAQEGFSAAMHYLTSNGGKNLNF